MASCATKTATENVLLTVVFPASVTCAAKENCPTWVGVPLNWPELVRVNPCGNDPDAILHWYGVLPPIAEIAAVYGLPACPPGSAEVVIDSADVPGLITTLALELFVGSATLVAVTVKFVLLETLGAESKPALETVPAVVDHVTAVLLVPCTRAVNCWLLPEVKVAEFGETDTDTVAAAGLTVTEERANLVASATLVAVMVAVVDAVTLGAVNIPPLLIVPPLAVHTTAVFEVFATVAVNCWVPSERMLDEVGETATLTGSCAGFTVIVDCECLLGSATLVAVTVAVVATVTLGAVNIPLLLIVPPLAVQVTAVFEVWATIAENCCVPADAKLALLGETAMLTGT